MTGTGKPLEQDGICLLCVGRTTLRNELLVLRDANFTLKPRNMINKIATTTIWAKLHVCRFSMLPLGRRLKFPLVTKSSSKPDRWSSRASRKKHGPDGSAWALD